MIRIALFCVALSLVVVAQAAYAEGPCPAGQIDVDSKCGGGYCTPVCAPIQNYGGGAGRAPQPQGEITTLGMETIAATNGRNAVLQALNKYGPGHWKFVPGKAGNCYGASYFSSKGVFQVTTDGGILLMGADLPVGYRLKSKQFNVVLVTTGNNPITASARPTDYVPILVLLPPLDLEKIFGADRLNVRVQSNGHTIFALDVPGALKVREKIRQCKQLSASK